MRLLLASFALASLAVVSPVVAAPEVVLLGPAADAKIPATVVDEVKQALDKAAVAPPGGKAIDATCAADTTCLTAAGGEVGAQRVLAISIDGTGGTIVLEALLVDVTDKELIAKRELKLSDRKLASELGPALRKFLEVAPIDRAKDLFKQGLEHYNLGEFAEALVLYKHAYRLKPLPAFLFNIAQCDRKLGHYKDAIAMYESYLVGVPNAPDEKMVQSLIAESKAALAEEEQVASERAADEAKRAAAEARRAAEERKAKEAEALAAVERRKAELARIEAEREREKLYDHHPTRKWTYVAGGVGVAALLVGGGFGLAARSAQSSYDSAGCGDPSQVLSVGALATCRTESHDGKRDALVADGLLIGGGAVLAASALVFVLDPGNISRPEEARARVAVSPGSVQVVVRW